MTFCFVSEEVELLDGLGFALFFLLVLRLFVRCFLGVLLEDDLVLLRPENPKMDRFFRGDDSGLEFSDTLVGISLAMASTSDTRKDPPRCRVEMVDRSADVQRSGLGRQSDESTSTI